MIDTTQDIAKIDQLSQVIRYVSVETNAAGKPEKLQVNISVETNAAGKPEKLQVNESFLGFVDQSASGPL